ncbi:lipopolysaccharide assembly protein LapA domain-containing protein [Acaryochloris sp. CCMEE 5410]|uniref:lipopolysaccharide assembly protein LapA domain-containing protein n=1 Tax=Acaryochloris sp. CCMEE 5410 TaxID=310037 RepID=UPI0002DCF527|nr:LapA family protein [Acaryochloris sp. CCMEE 5410]KAI9132411.1 LapA family protein [Acaryochloris sp. CCMEE 5410]
MHLYYGNPIFLNSVHKTQFLNLSGLSRPLNPLALSNHTIMHLLLSLLFSFGIAIAAILSVQNATAVSVHFLVWRSVPIPVGIVLGFATGLGVLGGAIATPLWTKRQSRRRRYAEFEDSEFTEDNSY